MKRKQIVFPCLRLKDEEEVILRFDSEIKLSKPITTKGEEAKKPASVARVTQLDENGVIIGAYEMVIGKLLESAMTETFENDYVGRIFAITRHAKAEGKEYKLYSVFEIEFDEQ